MCGRYAIYGPVSRKHRDLLEFLERELGFEPTWNAAPTQPLPVYRVSSKRGPELSLLRWGLVPYWAKNAAIGAKMINARDDTLAEKPAFRSAFERRRCLVPMSGFYEWQKAPRKVPHYIHLLNAPLFAVAGLWEYWSGKDGAEPIVSFSVITTAANDLIAKLHDRMPVILAECDYQAWLNPENRDTAALGALLKPYPAEEMRSYPVSPRVNSADNNGPELIEPVRSPPTPLAGGEGKEKDRQPGLFPNGDDSEEV